MAAANYPFPSLGLLHSEALLDYAVVSSPSTAAEVSQVHKHEGTLMTYGVASHVDWVEKLALIQNNAIIVFLSLMILIESLNIKRRS